MQSPTIKLPMVWNDNLSIGVLSAQDDMTPLLAPYDKAYLLQSFDALAP